MSNTIILIFQNGKIYEKYTKSKMGAHAGSNFRTETGCQRKSVYLGNLFSLSTFFGIGPEIAMIRRNDVTSSTLNVLIFIVKMKAF